MKVRFMPGSRFDQLMLDWLEYMTSSKEGVIIFHSIYQFMLNGDGSCPFDARKIAKLSNVGFDTVCTLMQPFVDKKIFRPVDNGQVLIMDYFKLNDALDYFIQTHNFVDGDKQKVNLLKVDAYYESFNVLMN